jgi:hypothetical protein
MLTDEQLIEHLRVGLARLRPRADLIERLREQAPTDLHGDRDPRERPQIAGRRRLRVSVGVVALAAMGVLSLGIAVGALVLVGHPGTTSPTAPSTSHPASRHGQGATRRPTRGRDLPALVSASQVAAPVSLLALPVARYCNDAATGYPQLVPCRPGLKPLAHPGRKPFSARPERLVQLTFTARRATGVNSWYEFELTAPRACAAATTGGPTYSPVRAGVRLRFEALLPRDCRGTIRATVTYVTQARHAELERSVLVGRRTLRTP